MTQTINKNDQIFFSFIIIILYINNLSHLLQEKMYASSCFYGPTHPTVEDQVELARRISYSLSDVKNMKSKGQSMYVNRKKRSVKWIHDGNGDEGEEEPQSPVHKVII